jgi:UDP-N-acetylglucosamine 4,6-dehydratase
MKILKNKTILITGGTGSFGNALINKIINKKINFKEIRVLSRDEKKQDDMRRKYENSKIKFYISDVRDKNSLYDASENVDYIFHSAALKQVPSCEFYPMEAVKTNILGTNNVLEVGIENKVKKIVCLSTDKSVYPINAMGMSKALMEKIAISKFMNTKSKTVISVTRYGNVVGSRGSIIPLLINQIKNNLPVTITVPEMTRFLMSLEDAMDLVLYAFDKAKGGEIFVKKAKSTTIKTLVEGLAMLLKKKKIDIKYIGIRHGEKMHETLVNIEELTKSTETKDYFIIQPDKRNLNYENYYDTGKKLKVYKNYSSENCKILNVNEVKNYLSTIDIIKKLI